MAFLFKVKDEEKWISRDGQYIVQKLSVSRRYEYLGPGVSKIGDTPHSAGISHDLMPPDNGKRYQIYNASISAHCCFEASVMDVESADSYCVCECMEIVDAENICKALNHVN